MVYILYQKSYLITEHEQQSSLFLKSLQKQAGFKPKTTRLHILTIKKAEIGQKKSRKGQDFKKQNVLNTSCEDCRFPTYARSAGVGDEVEYLVSVGMRLCEMSL